MEILLSNNFQIISNNDLSLIDGGFFIEIAIGLLGCMAYYGLSSIVKAYTGKHIHEWAGDAIIWFVDGAIYIFG